MKHIGLLGRKLSHSYSPQIHSKLFNYEYKLYEKEPVKVKEFMEKLPLDGINVTIPYKTTVIPYLARLSGTAEKIGSVNTVVKESDGSLSGYNTDYFGFSYMLEKSGISVENQKVLVLGSGGASLTVKTVLNDKKAGEIVTISRSGEDNYDNIFKHFDAQVIVNTTPVGMYPNVNASPLDLKPFSRLCGVLDLIYNPDKTMLISQAEQLGAKVENGLAMLVAQAKQSCELFVGEKIDNSVIDKIISGGIL